MPPKSNLRYRPWPNRTVHERIEAEGVYLKGSRPGRLIDRRRLKEKGVYFQFCSDLYETNVVLSVKMLRQRDYR